MAVVIETTLGDITVDLYLEQRPATCLNFLKLCKMKYYNFNLFHTIRSGFIAQTGDPTGEGSGGESIWGLLEGTNKRFFSGEKMPKIRHTDAGLLSMVCTDNMMVGSQFFFTLAPDLDSLDGVHCVIGEVTEGHEVLTKLNEVICDETHRPYQDVRITHTVILDDPFKDMPRLRPPSRSPSPNAERLKGGRIAPDEDIDETQGKSYEEVQEMIEEKEAKARATILEIVGDLPDADIAPPENVLFVCKLNPVTSDDDLEIIFSRFGKIVSCEVIRDKKTGDSLQYAFIEFENKKSCEDAYFKMDNVLIDDRRIHVDFSQSVSKMRWLGKGRGVQYFNDKESRQSVVTNNRSKRSHSRERNQSRRQPYKDRENRHRDNTYINEKKTENLHRDRRDRSRSQSRRDISKSIHSKNDRTQSYKDYSRDSNSSKNNKDNNKNKKKHRNSSVSPWRLVPRTTSPSKNSRKEHSKSPEKKKNENLECRKKYERETSNDCHATAKFSKKHGRDESDQNERKHSHKSSSKEHSNSKKEIISHINGEFEAQKQSASPEKAKRNLKAKKKNEEKKVKKRKYNVRKNKMKRKPSTSSSESDTSDSSSSTSESSSSSDGDKKKRVLKRKRKYSSSSSSSSSSSTSSSDSTSSSSNTSSDSSNSSSESEREVKRRKKHYSKKSAKKVKKL